MHSHNDETEVVVIGGGIGGLAAATFVAESGRAVRLFEQSRSLGGRAQTKEQDGFYLNIGPHALYRSGRGIEVLRELGIEPKGSVPSVSGAYAVKDGVKHTFPAGAVSLLMTSLFGLSAKLEAARLLASIGRINGERLMNVTVQDWLDQTVSHAEVRDLILAAFRVATYTNAPDLMSAGTAIEQLKKAQDKSVLYLDGGWQTLVDALREAATRNGVKIETGVKVDTVMRDPGGSVTGVRLAHESVIPASTVIVAASPSVLATLIEGFDQTSLAQIADRSIPVRAACLDVALSQLPKPKATFALGIDRPYYFSVHSAAARLAPENAALIHAAKYLSPDHDVTSDSVQRELEGLFDLMQPGWRELVVYRRFLPDMIVMNALPLASFGGTTGRPNTEVADVAGLFVVGDWVGNEGLLVDASLATARRAAELIAASPIARVAATA